MNEILTPAIISTFITAIFAPLIFNFLKRRDEINKRNFEVRYSEYKKYLNTLEEISNKMNTNFEKEYIKVVSEVFNSIISNPEKSNEALRRLNNELQKLTNNLRTIFSKATSELYGLKLVCSDKLFNMIEEFISTQKQIMKKSINFMGKINLDKPSDFSFIENNDIKKLGSHSEKLFQDIVLQMRKELGISKSKLK